MIPKFSRRSILAGAAATNAQLLFRTRLIGAAILSTAESGRPTAAPGLVDLTLTAMTANTLRIGIAPATAEASAHELGFVDREWPAPLETPVAATARTTAWGKYTVRIETDPLIITIFESEKKRQQVRFDLDSTNIHFALDGPVFGLGEGTNWYDDDGISYAHERGEFMRAECAWNDAARTLTITRGAAGRMTLPRTVRVELAGSNESRKIEVEPIGATVKF